MPLAGLNDNLEFHYLVCEHPINYSKTNRYDRKGSLQKDKDADILILDRDLNVKAVWAMGQLVKES